MGGSYFTFCVECSKYHVNVVMFLKPVRCEWNYWVPDLTSCTSLIVSCILRWLWISLLLIAVDFRFRIMLDDDTMMCIFIICTIYTHTCIMQRRCHSGRHGGKGASNILQPLTPFGGSSFITVQRPVCWWPNERIIPTLFGDGIEECERKLEHNTHILNILLNVSEGGENFDKRFCDLFEEVP